MVEIRLEQLIGRRVVDGSGRVVGRLEVVHAEREDGEWIVREYVLGVGGLVERLAAGGVVASLLGRFAPEPRRHVVPWDALDLSDVERPRLTRALSELRSRAA